MDGVILPGGQVMKEVKENWYEYLGVIEVDGMKVQEMKDIFANEYKRRLKLAIKSNLMVRIRSMALIHSLPQC